MSYTRQGYLALKKEASPGVALKPDTYVEILSETLTSAKPIVPSSPVYGSRSKHLHANRGAVPVITGDVTFEVEPNTIGYFLTGAMGAPSTSGPADTSAYTHVFTQPYTTAALPTFTIDICMGSDDWVRRYVGCKIHGLSFKIADNVWQCTAKITARYQFISTRVKTTALSGTALVVYQTSGLVAGSDSIIISPQSANVETVAVTTITNETTLVVGTFSKTHTQVTDEVVIAKSSPSFTQLSKLTFIGNTVYKEGLTIGAVSSVAMEDFSLDLMNDVEGRNGTSSASGTEISYYPTAILDKGFEASCTTKRYWTDEQQIDLFQFGSSGAIELTVTGNDLAGAASTYSSMLIQLPGVFNEKDPTPNLSQDEIQNEDRQLKCYYDATATYAAKITVVNKVASY